ncbi:hypothetical protein [Halobacterium wangiae]|uniref:hypothetical protein n=1 Tax=Halobacterium wangiae TaxID=2902623 RepID=UPI001E30DCB7|nr:hypothetical protein [Halobacterium wangiae]
MTTSGLSEPKPENLINASVERVGNKNRVQITYHLTDLSDAPFEVSLPPDTTLVSKTGFSNQTEYDYDLSWDHSTRRPSITFAFNETSPPPGKSNVNEPADYGYSDTWALAPLPEHFQPHVNPQPADEGVAGQNVVFLGEVTVHERATECHQIRLVIPEAASLSLPPEDLLELLAGTAQELDVGYRHTVVTAIASPNEMSRGGFAVGPDMVVDDDASVESASSGSMWIHEYVHTRQGMALDPEMEWFTEASAMYYQYRLLYEQNRISRAEYERFLVDASRAARDDVVLANNTSWHDNSEYVNGALVLAALDYRVRGATDGNNSLADVFRLMNQYRGIGQNDTVTYSTFADTVANVSGQHMDPWLAGHVRGSEIPRPGEDVAVTTLEGKVYRISDSPVLLWLGLFVLVAVLVIVSREE